MWRGLVFVTVILAWGCSGDGDCEPQAEVPYDGIDQDCDGVDVVDVDGDGSPAEQAGGDDCDDTDPDVGPFSVEVPYDGIDQDCIGGDLTDADADGFDAMQVGGLDCDDADPRAYPGAPDVVGDDEDQSCDGVDGVDADGDTFASLESGGTDCDDTDAAVHPDATEIWYDGVDQDCDAACDHDQDDDGHVIDGHVPADGDRCDLDPADGQVRFFPDCDDTDPLALDNFWLATDPVDEATGIAPTATVSLTLLGAEPTGSVQLADAVGAEVAGTTDWSGSTLTFTPDEPLILGQAYTATAEWTCGPLSWNFTVVTGP
ncbi:MAG: Ig-like domain-containing protein [Myxococcales bacterium]|nr:Ig-like domain-containing protein [Myxococcales bacterium]